MHEARFTIYILNFMAHPKKERTLVILKPDAIQRSLVGEILSRFERTGLKFVAFKFFVPDAEKTWAHYGKDDEWFLKKGTRTVENRKKSDLPIEKEAIDYGKDIIQGCVDLFTCGPVFAAVIEGNQSVAIVKKLVGDTDPTVSDVGTIRGDFTIDSIALANVDARAVRNLVHCSDSVEEAEREIKLWFDGKEIIKYRLIQEEILYDVNIDGILE